MSLQPRPLLLVALAAAPLWGACAGTSVSPDAARLHADVAWLADDARMGRRAGTDGERAAAEWIGRRMGELGLEPAGAAPDGEATWFQEFTVPLTPRDGGGSHVGLRRADSDVALRVADPVGVRPLFCSSGGELQGGLVFCGYGISDAGLGREDFPADEVIAGAGETPVALIVRGLPPFPPEPPADAGAGEVDPHGGGEERAPTWGNTGSLFLKVMNAKRRGFGAVIVAQHPAADDPLPAFDAGRGALAGIPALVISAEVARGLIPDYDARIAALDAGGRGEAVVDGRVSLRSDVQRGSGTARNVLGLLRGEDSSRTVVVGAHYDHLGIGGAGSLAPGSLGAIHNGADDNASGTAAVLEIARLLGLDGPPECDVLFALWSGEELGLLGSDHWAENPTVAWDGVVANLNLDMVGRAGDGVLQVLGAGTSSRFARWLEAAGPAADLELEVSLSGQGLGGSDHQVFLNRGVPALHLFSGVHTDYHKPSDDIEGFEAEGTARVVALSVDLVERMAGAGALNYVEPEIDLENAAPRERGWSVWFGTIPSYTHDGVGLKLDGTSAGSPAERAGLLGGDVILQVGDVEIATIHDFVYMLQVYKPGDVVLTRYLRDGAEQEVRITLATRDAQ